MYVGCTCSVYGGNGWCSGLPPLTHPALTKPTALSLGGLTLEGAEMPSFHSFVITMCGNVVCVHVFACTRGCVSVFVCALVCVL